MPQANFFLDDEEHLKVARFAEKWNLAAYKVIKRMIREYPEDIELKSNFKPIVID